MASLLLRSSARIANPSAKLSINSSMRAYATEPTASSSSSTSKFLLYGLVGGALLYGGKYAYDSSFTSPASTSATKPEKAGIPTLTDPNAWVDLTLKKVSEVSHDTKKFTFALPSGDHVIGLNVASALLTKYKDDAEGSKPVIRPYTPVSDETHKGEVDLLIKSYPDGKMSQHVHNLKEGETLSFKGPIEKYKWTTNKHESVALIAGGTGITPMYQLIRAIFNNPEDKTDVRLIFANKTEQDILLKREFEDLEQNHPDRFRAFYVLNEPPSDWPGKGGFITKEILEQALPSKDSNNIKVFVCGPPPFYKAVSGEKASVKDQGEVAGILKELGYTKDQVFKF